LQVATSSAAWAQNLAFERRRILEKLNAQIGSSLIDIRFSTAQWHNREESTQPIDTWLAIWQDHPSRLPGEPAQPASQPDDTNEHPEEAFQSWADMVKRRSQHLPLCPRCQCPTPQGELERWSVCALCAVKQW
jgi:predicted nucleic acid-binding Zn ribbon protein